MKRIADVGVRNAAVLDVNSGLVSGNGGTFLIDESLLSKIKFIKEGHFTDNAKAPALKLVGSVESISGALTRPTRKIVETKAIRTPDLFHAFFDEALQHDPLEYIKQIAFESSAQLPLHFFMKRTGQKTEEIRLAIDNLATRGLTKKRLLERLRADKDLSYPKKESKHPSSPLRSKKHAALVAKNCAVDHSNEKDIIVSLQSVRMLSKSEFDKDYVYSFLKTIYLKHYSKSSSSLASEIRVALCYVDQLLFKPETT